MEYLDYPVYDETAKAHPAYWRGKANGINAVLQVVANIMQGVDDGSGTNNHKELENMRRGLLAWRDRVDISFDNTKGKQKVEKGD
jgi:hypothetical protein